MSLSGHPIWTVERAQRRWSGLGAQHLLDLPLTAFFASRQCPGAAIRAATDWALAQAKVRRVVIGGFHSPLEQSVLHLLLQAKSPVVAVLARPVAGASLKPDWKTAIAEGRMAVVSPFATSQRLTRTLAAQRNESLAHLSDTLVVAHAQPGGDLAQLLASRQHAGQLVDYLAPTI